MKEKDIPETNLTTLLLQFVNKDHIKIKHEGVRYPRDQYEYVATRDANLKRHIDSIHEKVRYPCDQCEYAATEVGFHYSIYLLCSCCQLRTADRTHPSPQTIPYFHFS